MRVWESGCFVNDPVLTGNLSAPYLQYRMVKILEGWSEACEMSFLSNLYYNILVVLVSLLENK